MQGGKGSGSEVGGRGGGGVLIGGERTREAEGIWAMKDSREVFIRLRVWVIWVV